MFRANPEPKDLIPELDALAAAATSARELMTGIVGLQLTVGAERVGDDRIADFVTQSAAVYGDPYTGRPLEWQESGRSLSFRPGADRNINYFPWPIGSRANEDRH